MKETQLVKQILDYCKYRDLPFYRTQAGMVKLERGGLMKFGSAGVPDITGCLKNGLYCGVECKVGKNYQTTFQKEFEAKILANKGVYVVIRDLEEFIKLIQKYA